MKKFLEKFYKALRWLFGCFFALLGLAGIIAEGFSVVIIFLFALAVIVSPLFKAFIGKKRIFIACILFFLVCLTFPETSKNTENQSENRIVKVEKNKNVIKTADFIENQNETDVAVKTKNQLEKQKETDVSIEKQDETDIAVKTENPVKKQEEKQVPLLKYEVFDIEKLNRNRLNLKVVVKGKVTEEKLNKLSNHLISLYYEKGKTHGIYISYKHKKDAQFYAYGQVEYGPDGSAGYNEENLGKENRLSVSREIMDVSMIEDLDNSAKKEKANKPKKEELKKYIFDLVSDYDYDEDSFFISTFEDGFSPFLEINDIDEETGLEIIKTILNSSYKIAAIDILIRNEGRFVQIGWNGEKFFIKENGESKEITD